MPIVTAAVHRGFGSRREPLPLTFRHWAGVSPYTSPYGLAETCVFGKQSPGPAHCAPRLLPGKPMHNQGDPFSRSYGVNLPSSLTRVLSPTSGYLPLPTCVGFRYGRSRSSPRGFSRQHRLDPVALTVVAASRDPSAYVGRAFLHARTAYGSRTPHVQWGRRIYQSGSPRASTKRERGRNTNRLSIACALRPRLRPA